MTVPKLLSITHAAEDVEAFIEAHTCTITKGGGAGEVRHVDGT